MIPLGRDVHKSKQIPDGKLPRLAAMKLKFVLAEQLGILSQETRIYIITTEDMYLCIYVAIIKKFLKYK